MNIKNNIINYLKDKDYIISIFDNYLYIYNYKKLLYFSETRFEVRLNNIKVIIDGSNLTIKKMNEEELMICGNIKLLKLEEINEES